jgi:hypothetical protein
VSTCTHCESTGFLNLHLVDDATLREFDETGDHELILRWIDDQVGGTDVKVCDCCGDGVDWHAVRGRHWGGEDSSAYAYNGGLPECS